MEEEAAAGGDADAGVKAEVEKEVKPEAAAAEGGVDASAQEAVEVRPVVIMHVRQLQVSLAWRRILT